MTASYHKVSQLSAAFGKIDSASSSAHPSTVPSPKLMYSWNPYDSQCAAVFVDSSNGCPTQLNSFRLPTPNKGSQHSSPASSAASSVDFLSAPNSLRASVCGDVADIEEGLSMVAVLRMEPKDNDILTRMSTMDSHTVDCILKALTMNPGLVMELCEQSRGNVVSHLVATVGGDACAEIISVINDNVFRLAKGQSGCVALSRVYDAATTTQQIYIAEQLVSRFTELSLDPFGNYVVQRLFKSNMPRKVSAACERHLCDLRTITTLTRSKSGSHVVEALIKQGPADVTTRVVTAMLNDDSLVQTLAFDPIGNYAFQAALRFACSARCEDGGRLCSKVRASVPDVAEGSPYNININKSMGLSKRRTA